VSTTDLASDSRVPHTLWQLVDPHGRLLEAILVPGPRVVVCIRADRKSIHAAGEFDTVTEAITWAEDRRQHAVRTAR